MTRIASSAVELVERATAYLLWGTTHLFNRPMMRGAARGYNAAIAHSPLGPAVGRGLYALGSSTQAGRLLTTRADQRLRALMTGGTVRRRETLGDLERFELGARHAGLATTSMLSWVIPFFFGTNPNQLRLRPGELRVFVRRFRELLARDMQNAGVAYPRRIVAPTFSDLNRDEVAQAMMETHRSMLRAIRTGTTSSPQPPSDLPVYLTQFFHWRDWSQPASALSWDVQTEILFNGAYGAMLRDILPDLVEAIHRSGRSRITLLEVGGGTGILSSYLLETLQWLGKLPRVTLEFVEPVQPNMELARRRLARWGQQVRFHDFKTTGALAEKLPQADNSVDLIFVTNVFHEIPPHSREEAAREFARVLRRPDGDRPGGRLVFLDSAQYGDGIDDILRGFGGNGHNPGRGAIFHEPFYTSYCELDLPALFARQGLIPCREVRHAFVAKSLVFERNTLL